MLQLLLQLFVDPLYDLIDLWQELFHHPLIPLFQRFAHHRMIGIGKHLSGDIKGLVKYHPLFPENPNELGNGHYRVGIVELHTGVHWELM